MWTEQDQDEFLKAMRVARPAVRRVDVRQYLREQRCVLWGQAFDIHQPDTRELAAQWLEGVLRDLGVME